MDTAFTLKIIILMKKFYSTLGMLLMSLSMFSQSERFYWSFILGLASNSPLEICTLTVISITKSGGSSNLFAFGDPVHEQDSNLNRSIVFFLPMTTANKLRLKPHHLNSFYKTF